MQVKHALIIAIIVSVVLTGSLGGFYFYQQTKLLQNLGLKFYELNNQIEDTQETLQAQIAVEADTLREELDQRSDFLIQRILEVEAKSTEEIEKVQEEARLSLTGLEQKLKNVQISSQDFTAIVGDVIPAVIFIRTDVGTGSGAIVDRDGIAITNYHVLDGAKYGQAHDYEGTRYSITLLGFDKRVDIAVIQVGEGQRFRDLDFGNSNAVNVGQKVIAVGNPGGYSFSVTEGIISAVHRIGPNNIPYLQHDVAINPGNSGGPLIDASGDLIGINTMKLAGFEGIGFAIESNTVKQVYEQILADLE